MICVNTWSELAFFFSLHVMMTIEGGVFSRGTSGAGLRPIKGLIFARLHVLLLKFYSSLIHQKVVERVR